jgi:hypothetical protein
MTLNGRIGFDYRTRYLKHPVIGTAKFLTWLRCDDNKSYVLVES